MEGRKVVVAALQFACTDDVSTNIDTAERLVRTAHKKGANIILIQELFEGYYFCQAQREDFFQRAKPYKGHPTILRMQNLAERVGGGYTRNLIFLMDQAIKRSSILNPGDTGFKCYIIIKLCKAYFTERYLQVFQTKFAKIGVAICWDQWFPEAARAMALQGAEILFYPTAIGTEPQDDGLDSREHWKRVMQGHAGANLVPLVASNRIGKEVIQTGHGDSEITFYGNSFIAGPAGEIVASADDKTETVITAEFDLDKTKSKRHSWGIFRDRRPELYKVLLTLDGTGTSVSQ
ncbi:unnamed protein product [Rhodiola kirilowii]